MMMILCMEKCCNSNGVAADEFVWKNNNSANSDETVISDQLVQVVVVRN